MKILIALILGFPLFPFTPVLHAQEREAPLAKVILKTVGGDTLSGTPGVVKDGSVSIVTDYGVVRVPVDNLSEESKAKLGITGDQDVPALKKRISELEALVERLRDENAQLRKSGQAAAPAPAPAPAPAVSGSPSSPPAARPSGGITKAPDPTPAAGAYRLSSTGKRHNSRCRYYGSAGRACGPADGVACKVCGG